MIVIVQHGLPPSNAVNLPAPKAPVNLSVSNTHDTLSLTCWGLIFESEIHQKLYVGQQVTGYIKKMREDGRIDLILSRAGKGKVIDFTDKF